MDKNITDLIITKDEFALINGKNINMRLGFALLLKYFEINLKFPNFKKDIKKEFVKGIATQLNLDIKLFHSYKLENMTATYHKSQIRNFNRK